LIFRLTVHVLGMRLPFYSELVNRLLKSYCWAVQLHCKVGDVFYEPPGMLQLHCVPKKYYTKLMTITFSILNVFSKFFHCWKER